MKNNSKIESIDPCFFKSCLKIVKNIILSNLRYHKGSIEVFLFGSAASGSITRSSDIDIGLLSKHTIDRDIISRMQDEIEESIVPFKIDIVDFQDVSKEFREYAMKRKIKWN